MSDPLATYIHDHLAGSRSALQLLQSLRDEHADEPLGEFAAALIVEVKEDRAVLETLARRVGTRSKTVKEAISALGERVGQLKLWHQTAGEFGVFEALEALALGVQGKLALWRALGVLAEKEARLRGVDYLALAARAETQHARVEERRLEVAPGALLPGG